MLYFLLLLMFFLFSLRILYHRINGVMISDLVTGMA
jgi:hypothetical protein